MFGIQIDYIGIGSRFRSFVLDVLNSRRSLFDGRLLSRAYCVRIFLQVHGLEVRVLWISITSTVLPLAANSSGAAPTTRSVMFRLIDNQIVYVVISSKFSSCFLNMRIKMGVDNVFKRVITWFFVGMLWSPKFNTDRLYDPFIVRQ